MERGVSPRGRGRSFIGVADREGSRGILSYHKSEKRGIKVIFGGKRKEGKRDFGRSDIEREV